MTRAAHRKTNGVDVERAQIPLKCSSAGLVNAKR